MRFGGRNRRWGVRAACLARTRECNRSKRATASFSVTRPTGFGAEASHGLAQDPEDLPAQRDQGRIVPVARIGLVDPDLAAMLRSQQHGAQPVGTDLKRQLLLYGEELKQVNVFRRTTDTAKFAERVYADVLS